MSTVNVQTRVEQHPEALEGLAPLMTRVVHRLNMEGVRYCHWKSNYYFTKGPPEDGADLDLLIDREDVLRFEEVIASMGFKRAIDPLRRALPSVHHYYGLDSETHKLVHLHIYHRILTGESILKNYSLPLEQLLLEETRDLCGLYVPKAPVEVVIFVLRLMLKHASVLEFLLLLRRARLGLEVPHDELEWLLADSSREECTQLLEHWLPTVDPKLFYECLQVLRKDGSMLRRYALAWKLRRQLRSYNRFSRTSAVRLRLSQFVIQTFRKLIRAGKSKQFATGGCVIAFIGPEATGKSTLVGASRDWVGGKVAARTIHAGKPPSSGLTSLIKSAGPLMKRLVPRKKASSATNKKSGSTHQDGAGRAGLGALVYAIRAISLAYDRRRLLVRARSIAANGQIVISDRYPSNVKGAMDSPRLQQRRADGLLGKLLNGLARWEERVYHQIPPPDMVVRLSVSVEVAKRRNRSRDTTDDEAYLVIRHRDALTWQRPDVRYVYSISTDQSLEETLNHVKSTIWKSI